MVEFLPISDEAARAPFGATKKRFFFFSATTCRWSLWWGYVTIEFGASRLRLVPVASPVVTEYIIWLSP